MSNIRNIKDLEKEKLALKRNLSNALDNPMSNIFSFAKTFVAERGRQKRLSKKTEPRNQLIDEGAKTVLTLVASTLVSRLKLGTIPKMIITSGVALATPYIVDIVQKKISSKK